jgi:hypothetical protein
MRKLVAFPHPISRPLPGCALHILSLGVGSSLPQPNARPEQGEMRFVATRDVPGNSDPFQITLRNTIVRPRLP